MLVLVQSSTSNTMSFCLGLVLEKCHVSNNQVKFALVLEKCHFEILPAVLMNLDVIFYLGLRSCL